ANVCPRQCRCRLLGPGAWRDGAGHPIRAAAGAPFPFTERSCSRSSFHPMRNALLVVLALVLAVPAGAQEPTLELRQALEIARLHSPLLPVAGGRLRTAVGAARERAAPSNPVLEIRQENVGGVLATDRFATVTLPIDLTLQRSALRAAGREVVAAATADSASAAREVEVTVATRYWGSALADALAESAASEAAAMEEIVAFEETRLGEGVVAEGVVLRARLEVERARLALARA